MKTKQQMIEQSKINILRAIKAVNSVEFCKSEAKRIYSDARGKYQTVRKESEEVLNQCEQYELTVDKPYKVTDEGVLGVTCGAVTLMF